VKSTPRAAEAVKIPAKSLGCRLFAIIVPAGEAALAADAYGPNVLDLQKESAATQELYGLDDPITRDYGMQLLTARRLVERGVRVVQCSHPGWD
jgi:Protein of unknown function (DUF1501)